MAYTDVNQRIQALFFRNGLFDSTLYSNLIDLLRSLLDIFITGKGSSLSKEKAQS